MEEVEKIVIGNGEGKNGIKDRKGEDEKERIVKENSNKIKIIEVIIDGKERSEDR